jgi:hypothetical protein
MGEAVALAEAAEGKGGGTVAVGALEKDVVTTGDAVELPDTLREAVPGGDADGGGEPLALALRVAAAEPPVEKEGVTEPHGEALCEGVGPPDAVPFAEAERDAVPQLEREPDGEGAAEGLRPPDAERSAEAESDAVAQPDAEPEREAAKDAEGDRLPLADGGAERVAVGVTQPAEEVRPTPPPNCG